jgi:hypothetical protein
MEQKQRNKVRGIILKEVELGEDFEKGHFCRIPDDKETEVYGTTLFDAIDKFFEKYDTDDMCLRD